MNPITYIADNDNFIHIYPNSKLAANECMNVRNTIIVIVVIIILKTC